MTEMKPKFFDLVMDVYVLRFYLNEDGTYGKPFTLDELRELQVVMGGPSEEDYLAALGPCGK